MIYDKTCLKCKQNKSIDDFIKSKRTKDGKSNICKICLKQSAEINKLKRKPNLKPDTGVKVCSCCENEKSLADFYLNPNLYLGVHSICKDCSIYKSNVWKKNNLEKTNLNNKKYRKLNSEKEKARNKKYRDENKELRRIYKINYRKNNKDKINEQERNRRKKDSLFRVKSITRCLINDAFTRACNGVFPKKNKRSEEIIGCDFKFFIENIEKQFVNWMSWENQGYCKKLDYKCSWHIDHIIPVSYAKTEEEIYLLNHWSNLQPLCGKINIEKQDKVYPCTNLELKITFWETYYERI